MNGEESWSHPSDMAFNPEQFKDCALVVEGILVTMKIYFT